MYFADTATLLKCSYSTDNIGNQITQIDSLKTVYCQIKSIGQQEHYAAAVAGKKIKMQLKMFLEEYGGEELVDVGSVRYEIERTYHTDNMFIELYLKDSFNNENKG